MAERRGQGGAKELPGVDFSEFSTVVRLAILGYLVVRLSAKSDEMALADMGLWLGSVVTYLVFTGAVYWRRRARSYGATPRVMGEPWVLDALLASWFVFLAADMNTDLWLFYFLPVVLVVENHRWPRSGSRVAVVALLFVMAAAFGVGNSGDPAPAATAAEAQPTHFSAVLTHTLAPGHFLESLASNRNALADVMLRQVPARLLWLLLIGVVVHRRRDAERAQASAAQNIVDWALSYDTALKLLAERLLRPRDFPEDRTLFERVRVYAYQDNKQQFLLVAASGPDNPVDVGHVLGPDDEFCRWLFEPEHEPHKVWDHPRDDRCKTVFTKNDTWVDFELRANGVLFGKISADVPASQATEEALERLVKQGLGVVDSLNAALVLEAEKDSALRLAGSISQVLAIAGQASVHPESEDLVTGLYLLALSYHDGCCFDRAVWYRRVGNELRATNAVGSTTRERHDAITKTVQDWPLQRLLWELRERDGKEPDGELESLCPVVSANPGTLEKIGTAPRWWRQPDGSAVDGILEAIRGQDCETLVLPLMGPQGFMGMVLAQSPFSTSHLPITEDLMFVLSQVAAQLWLGTSRAGLWRALGACGAHELGKDADLAAKAYQELKRQGLVPSEHGAKLEGAVNHMWMVAQTLEFMRQMDEGPLPELVDVPLVEIIKQAATGLGLTDQDLHYRDGWQAAIAKDELTVRSTPPVLRVVVQNILHNATKYRAEGSQIEIDIVADAPDRRTLEIGDEGDPMHVEDIELWRRDRPLPVDRDDDRRTGSRVGLRCVRALMRATGGEADVDNYNGKGCRVRLTMPATARDRGEA